MTAYDHDASFTNTSINSSAITDTSTATTAEIDNDNKLVTNVSVTIVYGGTATEGVIVRILQDVDGTNSESDDGAWAIEMPFSVSGTERKVLQVNGEVAKFKVKLTNDSGATVTATVKTKQATV